VLGQLVVRGGLEQEAVAVLLGQGLELLAERYLFVRRQGGASLRGGPQAHITRIG
jgi:hypothetical protein